MELFFMVGDVLGRLPDVGRGGGIILGHWKPLRCPQPHQRLPGRDWFHVGINVHETKLFVCHVICGTPDWDSPLTSENKWVALSELLILTFKGNKVMKEMAMFVTVLSLRFIISPYFLITWISPLPCPFPRALCMIRKYCTTELHPAHMILTFFLEMF
jgi:hypothetical protein